MRELERKQQKLAELIAARKAHVPTNTQHRIKSKWGRRGLSADDIRKLAKCFKPKTAEDLIKEEEAAKAAADATTVDGPPVIDPRSILPSLQGGPPPPLPIPPGIDRDHWLSQQRETEIPERINTLVIAEEFDLSPEAGWVYALLIAHSQPRRPGHSGEQGWRTCDVSQIGADPFLVLDVPRPEPPRGRTWVMTDPDMAPSAELRLAASKFLEAQLATLQAHGLVRTVGTFTEVNLSGVAS